MKHIWIDCDPGIDDAVMLAIAAAHQDVFRIHGISAVPGNVSADRVAENALRLSVFLGMDDIPVVSAARRPLLRTPVFADAVHGETGLGTCSLPAVDKTICKENALLLMREEILGLPAGETMTLVATGPLTNIALLLRGFPEVMPRIARIVLMGGSSGAGNSTPWAEFNMMADPDAASIVFSCGLPIVMCPLDLTEKCRLSREEIAGIRAVPGELPRKYADMLEFYLNCDFYKNLGYVNMHDATTILYLLKPELFRGRCVSVSVICTGEQAGHTVCTAGGNVLLLNEAECGAVNKEILQALCRHTGTL